MDPKFLVVELDSKEQALQLVQVMLEKGFGRLMLLDDLGKHPTLTRNLKDDFRNAASSPVTFKEKPSQTYPVEEKVPYLLNQESSSMVSSTGTKNEQRPISQVGADDEAVEEEEEEDMALTSRKSLKRSYEHNNESQEYKEQLMNLLCAEPELVPIGFHSADDEPTELSLIKKPSIGEYHECRLCGVRVKTPRSGRWNLQMHVIALHCIGRQYKCKECNYLDYRKSTMRKHTIAQHGSDIPPYNITDNIMKKEWHEAMQKCFPEFAHRTGFLS
ncbi:unnamed protein product [Caenorhabditis brenneri]